MGFDGSEIAGRARIAEQMAGIFANQATGTYVGIVRSVRKLGDDAALLRAVSGVVPAGADDIDPGLNAIQSLVARCYEGGWRVAPVPQHAGPVTWTSGGRRRAHSRPSCRTGHRLDLN